MPLVLNFFPLDVPREPLPYLVRDLSEGEKPGKGEARWGRVPRHGDPAEAGARQAVLCTERTAGGPAYNEVKEPLRAVRNSTVRRLLGAALRQRFEAANYLTKERGFNHLIFERQQDASDDGNPHLVRTRALWARVEALWSGDELHFGCLLRLKVLVRFRRGLDDTHVATAATGNEVFAPLGGRHRRATLLKPLSAPGLSLVQTDSGPVEVPMAQVEVPTSYEVLERYFREVGEPERVRAELKQTQVSAFTLTPSFKQNRGWRRQELDFVRKALFDVSDGHGRSILRWPNSRVSAYFGHNLSVVVEEKVS